MTILKEFRTLESKNKKFIEACEKGDLKAVKSLLNRNNLFFADIHADNDGGFRWACQNGNIEIVKYLLTSPDLKEHADIHANYLGFLWACLNGHLDVVKYLLTSPELKEHADIHACNDLGFRTACQAGHLEVTKYLLTSPDLKDHADIHADDDYGFRSACLNGYLDVVQYLLFFDDQQCIDFQKTEYNLNWAIENKYEDVIIAMMRNLKNNDFMQYVDYLPKIESYDKELYEKVKYLDLNNGEINSSVPELFM